MTAPRSVRPLRVIESTGEPTIIEAYHRAERARSRLEARISFWTHTAILLALALIVSLVLR